MRNKPLVIKVTPEVQAGLEAIKRVEQSTKHGTMLQFHDQVRAAEVRRY